MMVKVVIGLLLVGIAAWLYFRNSATTTTAPTSATTDTGTPDVRQTLGGISFVVTPGTASQNAAAAGAYSYDPNDPAAAQRRLDALKRAQIFAAQPPGTYQAQVAQNLAAQQQETAAIMAGVYN